MTATVRLWILLTVTLLSSTAVQALWPQPRNIQIGTKALRLASDFSIQTSGYHPPTDLAEAIQRTEGYLKNDGLERLVIGRGSGDMAALKDSAELHSMKLSLGQGVNADSISTSAMAALGSRDEAYTLTIPADGSVAEITANSTLGLFRGLTTFSQFWYTYEETIYALNFPIAIEDSPAYPYRGLMLDTARNFFPVDVIKRQLDAMSWVKMSTFHWHISDSQSFPLIVPGYELLAAKGAYSPSSTYSPKDVADITSYAAARGIDVIVEVDTPGHTTVIFESYPEHVACPHSSPWATYANEPPAGQLRLASQATTEFTADLFSSVASLFPGKYFSSGGDEINIPCYRDDPQTQASLNSSGKTIEQALDTFTQVTHRALRDKGKTVVVWEEMVLAHNVTLANDTIVMVWISSANAAGVAAKGYPIVHSPSNYFYLDCGAGEWIGNDTNGNSWCDPFKTWQKAYSFDPLANLTSDQYTLVLGGQQLLWTEQSSPNNVDPIVWPRAAVSAEVFWSGPGGNGETALPRLHDTSFRMERRGIATIPLQPMWCALRPGVCDLTA